MSVHGRNKFDELGDRPLITVQFDLVTTTYEADRQDRLIHAYGAGTVTLPCRGDAAGLTYCVVAVDGAVSVVEPEGGTTKALAGGVAAYTSVLLYCDGANWMEITAPVWATP